MSNHDALPILFAQGQGNNFAKAKNLAWSWRSFVKLLSRVERTDESRRAFDGMSKDEQDRLKSIRGWISGAQCDGKWRNLKNVKSRNLLTLDLDYSTKKLAEALREGKSALGRCEYLVHTTRRHTEEQPRLRIFVPLKRTVTKEEYPAFVRIVSWWLDGKGATIKQVDRVSARPAQMMFLPTASRDGEFWAYRNEGKLLDPDHIFAAFKKERGDWNDLSLLPLFDDEHALRKRVEKAEDPTQKTGIVGAFCRAYRIEDAIETFLSDKYVPSDAASGKPRYTYTGSTSSNGAVVEDDGLFLYSHHGHDPCCERLVNAFDLVRIHLFGQEDEKVSQDTPPGQLPSWKAMNDLVRADEKAKAELIAEKLPILDEFFSDIEDDDFEPTEAKPQESKSKKTTSVEDLMGFDEKPKEKKKNPWAWTNDLECDNNGRFVSSLANVTKIILNDPRIGPNVAYNEFLSRIALVGDIKTGIRGMKPVLCKNTVVGVNWSDHFNNAIRLILEEENGNGKVGWGLRVTDRDLNAAKDTAARQRSFHPVKTYLESLTWDGVPRIETCFSRYLGCPETGYTRQVSRNVFLACVARIYQPGHKFDFVVIIKGEQGGRKSTFVKRLVRDEWGGTFNAKFDDPWRIADQTVGKWILEMGEIHTFKKSDYGLAKEFVRRQRDDVRRAWDKEISELPRQFILIGTTNDTKFLRDPTGNRAYWPIVSTKTIRDPIDTDKLVAERDQLWAEALALYKEMREQLPPGATELDLSLQGEDVMREAEELQEAHRNEELSETYAQDVIAFLDTPMTLAQAEQLFGGDVTAHFPTGGGPDPDKTMVRLCAITRTEICNFLFNSPRPKNPMDNANLSLVMDSLKGWERETVRGQQNRTSKKWGLPDRRWLVRSSATPAAQKCGYEIVSDEINLNDLL
jgi:predicted P-loop ATPase